MENAKSDPPPFVSVIIPVLNEADYITQCLNSVLRQDYPKDKFEIIVVDNGSTDATLSLVTEVCHHNPSIKVLQAKQKNTAGALNTGITNSSGSIIVRMDAHAEAPVYYVSTCVKYLLENTADNVGGVMTTVGSGYWGAIVSFVQSSPFGLGNSKHRCSQTSGYDEAGWPGAFWKATLLQIGGYDESLHCNEDDDLNFRILKAGGKCFRTAEIKTRYFCRKSLMLFFYQYFRYGFYKVRVLRRFGKLAHFRHLIPSTFLLTLGVAIIFAQFFSPFRYLAFMTLGAYGAANVSYSGRLSLTVGWRYFPGLLVGFVTLHLSYGLGFFCGLLGKCSFRNSSLVEAYDKPGSRIEAPAFTRDPSLIIFEDLVCHLDGGTYSTNDSHIIFMLGMKRYCSNLSLFARVHSTPGVGVYEIPQSIDVHAIPYYKNVPSLCRQFLTYIPSLVRVVKNTIPKGDVISLTWPHPLSLLIVVLNRIWRADLIPMVMVRGNLKATIRSRYQGIYKFAALRVVDILEWQLKLWAPQAFIVTVGAEVYKQYVKSFPHVQLITCPLFRRDAMPEYQTRVSTRTATFRILFVGRLEPEKNLSILLECAAILKKEIKGFCVDIVGTGADEIKLQCLADKLDLTDVVSFHGYVKFGEDLFAYYRAADCFVLPTFEGEGFPKVLIESMVLGVPIIATRVGGIPYFISHKENGWLVEAGSPSAIVEAVRESIEDPRLAEKIRQRAKTDSHGYTMEDQQDKIFTTITTLLKSRHRKVRSGTIGS